MQEDNNEIEKEDKKRNSERDMRMGYVFLILTSVLGVIAGYPILISLSEFLFLSSFSISMLVIMLWIKCHTGAMQEDNNEIEKEDKKRNSERDRVPLFSPCPSSQCCVIYI
jgi:polyferredoxin